MGARSSQSRGPGLNETDGHLLEYFRNTFGAGGGADSRPSVSPVVGHTATGGVISDYTDGTDVYRAHIFTSSGTFAVTALGNQGNTVEYLLVAGGGGGSSDNSQPAGIGGGSGGPYAGAGNASPPASPGSPGGSGSVNSGSGGGGGTYLNGFAGAGGSGLVLIAYPT